MRIYVIDDEPKMLRMLHDAVAEAAPEAEILAFSDAAEAMASLDDAAKKPDVVFTDIEMPGTDGLAMAITIKNAVPAAKIIFVTGYDQYALEAYRLHINGYIMKPVDAQAIREELDQFLFAFKPESGKLYARCFGDFEVFWQGKPLLFERRKTKELFAFLIDRRGAACSVEEIASALWEDEEDLKKTKHRVRNLVNDLRMALKNIGQEDVLMRKSGLLAILAKEIECDYYSMLHGDISAINSYSGEYMNQFSWAEITAGKLWFGR